MGKKKNDRNRVEKSGEGGNPTKLYPKEAESTALDFVGKMPCFNKYRRLSKTLEHTTFLQNFENCMGNINRLDH